MAIKEPELYQTLKSSQMHMFSDKIKKKSKQKAFWEKIHQYKKWEKELKEKRDPVAHRMPLYVVPQCFRSQDELERYEESAGQFLKQASQLNFERADNARIAAEKEGEFVPCFSHAPKIEYVYAIYPTIPD